MPRSKTRVRIRAAKLAAGVIQPDPDRTPARVRSWWRTVWKRMAAYEDRMRGPWPTRSERSRAIRVAIDRWMKAALAEMAEQDAAAARDR